MSAENLELIAGRVLDILNPVGEGGQRKHATWAFFSDFHNSDNENGQGTTDNVWEQSLHYYGSTAYYGMESLRSMARVGQSYHFDFILNGGDISSGRKEQTRGYGDNAELWINEFAPGSSGESGEDPVIGQMERIFSKINTIFPATPFISAVGNHDKKYGAESSLKTGTELHNVIGAAFNNSAGSGVTISWATADAGETNVVVDVDRAKVRVIVNDNFDNTQPGSAAATWTPTNHAVSSLNLGAGKDAAEWIVGFAHHGATTPGYFETACEAFKNRVSAGGYINTNTAAGYGWIPEMTGHIHNKFHYDLYEQSYYNKHAMRVQAAHDVGARADKTFPNRGDRGYLCYSVFIVDRDHGYVYEVCITTYDCSAVPQGVAQDKIRIYRFPIVTQGVDPADCVWDCFFAGMPGQDEQPTFEAMPVVEQNTSGRGKTWVESSTVIVNASDVVGGYVPPYVPPDDPDEPDTPVPPPGPGPGEGGIVMYRADGTPVSVSALWTRSGEMLRVVYRVDGSPLVLWSEEQEQDDNPTSGFWLIDGDGYRLIDGDGYALTVSA